MSLYPWLLSQMTNLENFMSNSVIEQKIVALKRQQQLIFELIGKLEDVASLETQMSSGSEPNLATRHVVPAQASDTVGGVRGIAKSAASAYKAAYRAKLKAKAKFSGDGKPVSLRSVVKHIVMQSKTPLSYPEVAEKAIASGYKTIAKDFGNNVYQSLNKLVRDKELKQRKENNVVLFEAA